MKYVKSFESHRKSKVVEPVNEELFGGIINFFKGLWSRRTKNGLFGCKSSDGIKINCE